MKSKNGLLWQFAMFEAWEIGLKRCIISVQTDVCMLWFKPKQVLICYGPVSNLMDFLLGSEVDSFFNPPKARREECLKLLYSSKRSRVPPYL